MSEDNPTDIHFAYAGYAPLSVRIVQQASAPACPSAVRAQPATWRSMVLWSQKTEQWKGSSNPKLHAAATCPTQRRR